MLGLFALLLQFERDLMRERTQAGVEAAALSGKRVGHPLKITSDRIAIAQDMAKHQRKVSDIAAPWASVEQPLYRMLADKPTADLELRATYPLLAAQAHDFTSDRCGEIITDEGAVIVTGIPVAPIPPVRLFTCLIVRPVVGIEKCAEIKGVERRFTGVNIL